MEIATRDWLQIIQMVGTFALGAWFYVEKRNDKTNERVSELATKMDQLDRDVASLQASATAAPNHQDLAKLYDSVNELAKTVNQLVGENRGQTDTLRLILNQITQKGLK